MRPPRLAPTVTAAASGLALATLALGGHAIMQDGWQGILHPLNDVPQLSADAWFGALLPLLLVLARFGQAPLQREAGIALRRFSTVGHWKDVEHISQVSDIESYLGNNSPRNEKSERIGILPQYLAVIGAPLRLEYLQHTAQVATPRSFDNVQVAPLSRRALMGSGPRSTMRCCGKSRARRPVSASVRTPSPRPDTILPP